MFDIHIERNALAIIKPIIIETGLPPNRVMILRAILLCKPHLSIERAIIKPPRNRKIIELMYELAISSASSKPNRGNRINGISEVAASGTASEIHQTAISAAIAAIIVTLLFDGSRLPNNNIAIEIIKPVNSPTFLVVVIRCKKY